MRTIKTVVYKFEELSDQAQEKAIDNCRYFNVEGFDWWESIYEDAENIGLKITEFDLDRRRHAKGDFYLDAEEVAKKIVADHGQDCETYKTATAYLEELSDLTAEHEQACSGDPDCWEEPDTEEIDAEFLRALLEDYSIMLQRECEYLMSDEAIKETIISNEYEFTEDGKMV